MNDVLKHYKFHEFVLPIQYYEAVTTTSRYKDICLSNSISTKALGSSYYAKNNGKCMFVNIFSSNSITCTAKRNLCST